MQRTYFLPRQLATALFIHVLLTGLVHGSADEISSLDRRLRAIRYAATDVYTEQMELETECLNLIPDYNSPSDKGKIYATMAFVYSDRGYGSDDDPNMAAQAFRYAMKALEYPLGPLTACYMHARASGALVAQSRSDPNKPLIEVREQAVDLCLKGLKLALDNNAPKEYPASPGPATNIDLAPGTPVERMITLRNHQIEAREQWLYETEFSGLRQGLFRRCLSLYCRKPHEQSAFENKVRKILKGHEQTAAELITALDAQNAKNEGD